MKLIDIKINNFMRFKGEQYVQFPQDSQRNVLLLYGENGSGKTSFLSAIRWGFYGKAYTRHKAIISLDRLVNKEASFEGDWDFSVEIKFDHDGHKFHLVRHAKIKSNINIPNNDSDYEINLFLKRDDHQFTADQIDSEINNICPEKVSRFFLFDGELLQEYESLLDEKNTSAEQIKSAIEQVLGVPALINGRTECEALYKQYTRDSNKELQNKKGFEIMAESQLRLAAKLDSKTDDLNSQKEKLKSIRTDKNIIDDEIDDLNKLYEEGQEIQRLKDDKKSKENNQKIFREELLKEASTAWKELLKPKLISLEKSLLSNFENKVSQIAQYYILKNQLSTLEEIHNTSKCPICLSSVANLKDCDFEINKVKGQLNDLPYDIEEFSKIGQQLSSIRSLLKSEGRDKLRSISEKIIENEIALVRIEQNLEDLYEKSEGVNRDEIKKKKLQYDNLTLQEGALDRDIKETDSDINTIRLQLDELDRQIRTNTDSSNRSKAALKAEIFSALRNTFSESIDLLREQLKEEVEKNATTAFKSIILEKDYQRLRINNNYGLSIEDSSGAIVDLRSAGQEEIVALSLIDGLSHTGRSPGPVVMDTPFGRIDPGHRKTTLEYLSKSANQLVLLVHEGEIDRQKDLLPIANKIGHQYEITKVNSKHSRIDIYHG